MQLIDNTRLVANGSVRKAHNSKKGRQDHVNEDKHYVNRFLTLEQTNRTGEGDKLKSLR